MLLTHIRQVKRPVGRQDNGKNGEDDLQDGKLEAAKLEQEERAPGVGTEETISEQPLITDNGFSLQTHLKKHLKSTVEFTIALNLSWIITAGCVEQFRATLGTCLLALGMFECTHICNNNINSPPVMHYAIDGKLGTALKKKAEHAFA